MEFIHSAWTASGSNGRIGFHTTETYIVYNFVVYSETHKRTHMKVHYTQGNEWMFWRQTIKVCFWHIYTYDIIICVRVSVRVSVHLLPTFRMDYIIERAGIRKSKRIYYMHKHTQHFLSLHLKYWLNFVKHTLTISLVLNTHKKNQRY